MGPLCFAPTLEGACSERREYVDHDDARGQERETKAKKARSVPVGFLTCDALLISFSHSRFSLWGRRGGGLTREGHARQSDDRF